jgi:predicted AAA+ superfamily ATPase
VFLLPGSVTHKCARQTGKTWSVNSLGEKRFGGRIHRIDLERNPEWHRIFEGNLDVSRILSELEILLNKRIEAGKDLLFIDEIQSCPRAVTALRYFYEEMPELHVIAAGSLLDFALIDLSFPVGRIQFLEMIPLTFQEFLKATGKDTMALVETPSQLSQTIHEALMRELRDYLLVGGMPEAVAVYAETKSIEEAFRVQDELIQTYRQDFSKYAPKADKRCINAVLTNVAKSVGNSIKYSKLAEGFSAPTIRKAFDLLCMARVITKVRSTSPSGLPLSANASEKKFKALIVDIGLMRALAGVSPEEILNQSQLLAIYQGALAEHFVGQELKAYLQKDPFFWRRDAKSSLAEVDYVVSQNNVICPIEVKSGPSGSLRSLHLLLKTYPNCPKGYVLSDRPYGEIESQNLVFLPLYFARSFLSNIRES